ncbi:PaaI family thioesterase [Staphylococcus cohnii]|uniref:PaaI family thioesterase n=1 Tax=Staphylococcus TaxID=1279 RepID=UPI0007D9B026|nr:MULTISPECIES: PaaI family thioesterase [Staphylococcus]MCQ9293218.1 PaaI family thioesterase [Staphylococcus cohnii]MBM9446978.1 PaaI family thioesterase [Staphylococcus ureilyticus]OAO21180.1 thioesterase [Staphylococcus cohnii]PTF09259.1 PaaI family thioesterase [Staphylococcus cohnii]PTF42303.1 PaaI family thioesterase [Staphylococcus cohnii]
MANMLDALKIKVELQEHGLMVMSMPVTDEVKQPFGFLHGGASLALGETACSMGAAEIIDTEHYIPLGLEMNANHIGSTTEGTIFATATIIHEGSTTQVWNIDIRDQNDRLICVMRGTVAIKPRKRQ